MLCILGTIGLTRRIKVDNNTSALYLRRLRRSSRAGSYHSYQSSIKGTRKSSCTSRRRYAAITCMRIYSLILPPRWTSKCQAPRVSTIPASKIRSWIVSHLTKLPKSSTSYLTPRAGRNGAGTTMLRPVWCVPCDWWKITTWIPSESLQALAWPLNFRRDFWANIQQNVIQITAEDFPVCLYDESEYDTTRGDPQLGLFHSQLLLKVYHHIFTGLSSAQRGKATGSKTSRGLSNHLDSPTPQTIAYAALMVRFLAIVDLYWYILSYAHPWARYRNGTTMMTCSISKNSTTICWMWWMWRWYSLRKMRRMSLKSHHGLRTC